ncbi:MAG TPA: hypothetical protein VI547_15100 [Anaerolineales bacterium]|nr:hypothetical protein [Anaerolineales bacterium]
MPRIRCHYEDCVFLEEKYCGAAAVEFDPDAGCMTYSQVEDAEVAEANEWDEDVLAEEEEEEDLYEEDEEEDDWDDEEEDEYG